MILFAVAALMVAPTKPEWIIVFRAPDATFSYDARRTERRGTTVITSVKAWMPGELPEDAGGYIFLTEFDCAGRKFRNVEEVILDHRGAEVVSGPALSQTWTPPYPGSGFTEVMERLCGA